MFDVMGMDFVKTWRPSLAMEQLMRQRERVAAVRRRRTTLHNTNSKRECARRQRQIEAGSLRVANGLVL